MSVYISGIAYVLIGYTIRLVVYCVIYAAVSLVLICLAIDDRSERFFKSERQGMLEKSDDTGLPPLLTERARQ
jgi:hypothetical protein